MKEISTISLERMNNGAHFLYVSNILTRAETDAKVKTKVAAQVATVTQEDKDLKISQKNLLTDELPKQTPSAMPLYRGYKKAIVGFLNLSVKAIAQVAQSTQSADQRLCHQLQNATRPRNGTFDEPQFCGLYIDRNRRT